MSISPKWQVVPLQETTGRTLGPVPPTSILCSFRKRMREGMFSYLTPWISTVIRLVKATSDEPNFSAASKIIFAVSVEILPFPVIVLTLNTSGYLLSRRQPRPFTAAICSLVSLSSIGVRPRTSNAFILSITMLLWCIFCLLYYTTCDKLCQYW